MSELICNLDFSEHPIAIPTWAFDYLLTHPLRNLFNRAASRAEHDIIPLDAEIYALRHLDIGRIMRRRWIRDNDDVYHLIILSLYRDRNSSVVPFIMIGAGYIATLTERARERACFIEAQWPQRLSGTIIRSIVLPRTPSADWLGPHLQEHREGVPSHRTVAPCCYSRPAWYSAANGWLGEEAGCSTECVQG